MGRNCHSDDKMDLGNIIVSLRMIASSRDIIQDRPWILLFS
jgi:hypothetical protein